MQKLTQTKTGGFSLKPKSEKQKPVFMTKNVVNATSKTMSKDKVDLSQKTAPKSDDGRSQLLSKSLSDSWADDAKLPGGDAGLPIADDAHLPGGDAGLPIADDAHLPGGDEGPFSAELLQSLAALLGQRK